MSIAQTGGARASGQGVSVMDGSVGVGARLASLSEQIFGLNTQLKSILVGINGECDPPGGNAATPAPANTHGWLNDLDRMARENNALATRIERAL